MIDGVVEIKGLGDWWQEVLLRFGADSTTYTNREDHCIAIRESTPTNNVMIGRFCKIIDEGYILDRRSTVRPRKV